MNDQSNLPLQALPDGEAELRLVLHLRWEDVAALGQEAGRLASQLQRPVSLDEAASHRLRGRSVRGSHAQERGQHAAPAQSGSLNGRSPVDQVRQAIDKANGTSGANGAAEAGAPKPATASAGAHPTATPPKDARAGAERSVRYSS